jgi:ABC-type multidrug transport system ATPase subunit
MNAVIRTEGLTKRFGSVLAVDGIDLDVRQGDRYGFLGPNGSGKTTTVRMVLGLVFATSGTIELLGHPVPKRVHRALADVGALIEGPAAYGHLSAGRNLTLMDAAGPGGSRRSRRARVAEVLEQVGLDAVGRRPVKAYSLGMRQRLGLAAALLRTPRLLVLDEPTNGLDPQGIREVRDLLRTLNERGTTVFLSSHQLAEVGALCTRVGVLDRGRLVLQDDLATLQRPTGRVVVRTTDPEIAASVLDGQLEQRDGDRLVVRGLAPEELSARLVHAGARITELVGERQTLEDVVLAVTSSGSDRVAGGTAGRTASRWRRS